MLTLVQQSPSCCTAQIALHISTPHCTRSGFTTGCNRGMKMSTSTHRQGNLQPVHAHICMESLKAHPVLYTHPRTLPVPEDKLKQGRPKATRTKSCHKVRKERSKPLPAALRRARGAPDFTQPTSIPELRRNPMHSQSLIIPGKGTPEHL